MAELTRPALTTKVDTGIDLPMAMEASAHPSTLPRSQDGAMEPLPGLDLLTSTVTTRPRCSVTPLRDNTGPCSDTAVPGTKHTPRSTQPAGADMLVPTPSMLTSTVTARLTWSVMTPWEDIGPPTAGETVLSTTNITQHYSSGAAIRAHGPHGLISTVTASPISPVTITSADIGLDSQEASPGAHPPITVPTGARVESPDTPTSGMMPLTPRPQT